MHVLPTDVTTHIFSYLTCREWIPYAQCNREINRAWEVYRTVLCTRWLRTMHCSPRECTTIRLQQYNHIPKTLFIRNIDLHWCAFIKWLNKEKRLPERLKCQLYHDVKQWSNGPVHDVQIKRIENICMHVYQTPCVIAQPCRILHQMIHLPYASIEFTVHPTTYTIRDKKFICKKDQPDDISASISKHGIRPTGLCTQELLETLEQIEKNPIQSLVEYSTRCPWCCLSFDDPSCMGYDCSMKWAEWGTWVQKMKDIPNGFYFSKLY